MSESKPKKEYANPSASRASRTEAMPPPRFARPMVGAQRIDLLLKVRIVDGEQVRRQVEPLPAWIVPIKSALEVAGDGRQSPLVVRTQSNRVELQGGQAEVVIKLPELGQALYQGRNQLPWRLEIRERVGDHECFQARQWIEGDLGDSRSIELLDIHAPVVSQRHGWRPELSGVSDGEIDLVLGRNAAFEGHAVGLGALIARPRL